MKTPTTSSMYDPELLEETIRRTDPYAWVHIAPTGVLEGILRAYQSGNPLEGAGLSESILAAINAEYNDRL